MSMLHSLKSKLKQESTNVVPMLVYIKASIQLGKEPEKQVNITLYHDSSGSPLKELVLLTN